MEQQKVAPNAHSYCAAIAAHEHEARCPAVYHPTPRCLPPHAPLSTTPCPAVYHLHPHHLHHTHHLFLHPLLHHHHQARWRDALGLLAAMQARAVPARRALPTNLLFTYSQLLLTTTTHYLLPTTYYSLLATC